MKGVRERERRKGRRKEGRRGKEREGGDMYMCID